MLIGSMQRMAPLARRGDEGKPVMDVCHLGRKVAIESLSIKEDYKFMNYNTILQGLEATFAETCIPAILCITFATYFCISL